MIRCVTLATPELGDGSSLLQVAVAVDPQRDFGRILSVAANARVRIICVAEAQIHNDYLSGGRHLADLLDVPYLVAADEDVSFPAWAAPLPRVQFRSARRLGELPDGVWLLPTHGFGSFCPPRRRAEGVVVDRRAAIVQSGVPVARRGNLSPEPCWRAWFRLEWCRARPHRIVAHRGENP